MKKYIPDVGALLIIAIVVGIFFFRLFWPIQQLIITPDFGISDAWHDSIAKKVLLSIALKSGYIPTWTSLIGDGYPILAEALTGTLFLMNLIIFSLFDIATGYNLSLASALIIGGWGMYAWIRLLKAPRMFSIFGAITFSFSGIILPQLTHIALIQSLTLMPLLFTLTHWAAQKPTLLKMILLSFVSSQQLFAGYPQIVFITQLFLFPYGVYQSGLFNNSKKFMSLWGIMIIIMLLFSSAQLLPSREFQHELISGRGFSADIASYFSYPFKHFITFINPFILGNPHVGTYPSVDKFHGSIFWENTGFIGIVPFIGLMGALFIKPARKKFFWFWITLGMSLLFMLGKYSPIYLVYSFWPFTLFRVPSRFLTVFVSFLIVISTIGLWAVIARLPKKYYLISVLMLLVIQTTQLLTTWWNYHAIESASKWLTKPSLASTLNLGSRIYTIGDRSTHNAQFLQHGWSSTDVYHRLRESIPANSNLIWNIPHHSVYSGRNLRRSSIIDSFLEKEITQQEKVATISSQGQKILSFAGITHVLSTVSLDSQLTVETTVSGTTRYRNDYSTPLVSLKSSWKRVETVQEAIRIFLDDSFNPDSTALVESDSGSIAKTSIAFVEHLLTERNHISFNVVHSLNHLAVINITNYPGWQGFIDGNPVPIIPANIKYMGVFVPPGSHRVDLRFYPRSYIIGATISAVSHIFSLLLVVVLLVDARFHIWKKVLELGRNHWHNRDT